MFKRQRIVAVFRGLAEDGRLPGGVAMAMRKILESNPESTAMLSFGGHKNSRILRQRLSGSGLVTETVAELDPAMVEGGYGEANEVYWPWAHDQDEEWGLKESPGSWSKRFGLFLHMNRAMTEAVMATAGGRPFDLLVNDYQLARVPRQVRKRAHDQGIGHGIAQFTHTPWGRNLKSKVIRYLDEFARGIISSDVLGFHTQEWVDTFLAHVATLTYSDGTAVNQRYIIDTSGPHPIIRRPHNNRTTRLVVQPIGIEAERWMEYAGGMLLDPPPLPEFGSFSMPKVPYILSVDRCDHTKGILDRFRAIKRFFEKYPARRGELSFLQMAEPTRRGVPHFDQYFDACQRAEAEVNSIASGDWKPLHWYKGGVVPARLGPIYREAKGIACGSWKDGFCMVFPDAIASASPENPTLGFLSPGCGCFATLGQEAISIDPRDPEGMAETFERGWQMPLEERRRRNQVTMRAILANPLATWATRFFDELHTPRAA